jgi:hypothetical protein
MEMLNPDIWKQQWAVFVSAPYIIGAFIAGAGLIGWWLRGIKSESRIDGLEARLALADARVAWANEVKDESIKAIEAIRQFENLKAGIVANEGSTLAEIKAKVDAALEKLLVANHTARSAIATAAEVGVSDTVGIGESLQGEVTREDMERLNDDPT